MPFFYRVKDPCWSKFATSYHLKGGLPTASMEYNLLNLPKKVSRGTENISYIYSATGNKLAMLKGTTVVNFYAGTCIYKGNKALDYLLHPEGVVRATGQGLSYEYFLKDHLGNTRVVFGSDGAVLQTTDYYAFGMAHTPKAKENENRYLYNGKEQQDALIGGVKFDWYDYGARFYDAALARWHVVDPLAHERVSLSPYNYCSLNPINRIDPDGMTDFRFDKKTGEVTQVGEANDDPDRIVRTNQKGEVKYKKNGEAKVAVDGIEKGILKDGQNFKTEDQVISVGGEGQPTLTGIEDFLTKMGEYVGVEIAGAYLSKGNAADADISKVYIDEYRGNKTQESSISLTKLYTELDLKGFNTITHFHTHPSNLGISRTDVERPSYADLKFRDNNMKYFYNFLILTRSANYPYKVQSILYNNWK